MLRRRHRLVASIAAAGAAGGLAALSPLAGGIAEAATFGARSS
jgi:hypothetical protein